MRPTFSALRRVTSAFLLAVFAIGMSSCSSGESLNPVTGKVLYKGQPAAGALVSFHPEGDVSVSTRTATANTDADGVFWLSTGDKKGAAAGKYTVTVVYNDPAKRPTDKQRMQGATDADAPDLLGGRYATREKSTLKAEVKSGDNKLEPFDLK